MIYNYLYNSYNFKQSNEVTILQCCHRKFKHMQFISIEFVPICSSFASLM